MTLRSIRIRLRNLTLLALLACLPPAAPARAESLVTGPTHRGVVNAGPYQIFPENRVSNAVYADGVLLLNLPDQTLLDVSPLPARNKFVYLARQGETRTVGVRSGPADPAPRITEVSPGYFFVVAILDGAAYKKLYRVKGASLTDLLPLSKTVDGVTVGTKAIAFFHIAKADQPDSAEATYHFGLHVALFGEDRVRHRSGAIDNGEPNLALKWLSDSVLQYTLADGTEETMSLSDFK